MEVWATGKIKDFALVKGGKRLPKGRQLMTVPNSHPYIRIRDLGKSKVLELNVEYEYVDDDTQKTISRYIVDAGDILISVVGTIGLIGIVGKSLDKANQTENCDKITNVVGLDSEYLYYYLVSPYGQEEIKKGTVGAVQPKLPLKNVQDIKIIYPSLETQRKIVGILGTIDSKIETNNAINKNLEEQLTSLYTERFANRSNGILSDLCEYTKEKIEIAKLTLNTYFSTENILPNKEGTMISSGLPNVDKVQFCKTGNVLISNIRPYFKKIVFCHDDAGCSTDVLCFVAKHDEMSPYIFSTLYRDEFFNYMMAGAKGTKMPRGDKQQIMRYPVYVPTNEELKEFSTYALGILKLVHSNKLENQRLAQLRDTLLPKLMSGELDVSELDI